MGMRAGQCLLAAAAVLTALVGPVAAQDELPSNEPFGGDTVWRTARATHFGTDDWSIHEGSCGYDFIADSEMYDKKGVAALADTFSDDSAFDGWETQSGGLCGACYEVRCIEAVVPDPNTPGGLSRCGVCKPGAATVQVKIIDVCMCDEPENPVSNRRWCCGDVPHFDLSYWAFEEISEPALGVIGVEYRRVPCQDANGDVKLRIRSVDTGRGSLSASLQDTAGAGKVELVEVREAFSSDDSAWRQLQLGWENSAVYEVSGLPADAPLAVRVTAANGEQIISTLGVGLDSLSPGATIGLGQQFGSGELRMVRAQSDETSWDSSFGTCGEGDLVEAQKEAVTSIKDAGCGQPLAASSSNTNWWCQVFSWIPGGACDRDADAEQATVPCAPPQAAVERMTSATPSPSEPLANALDSLQGLQEVVDRSPP